MMATRKMPKMPFIIVLKFNFFLLFFLLFFFSRITVVPSFLRNKAQIFSYLPKTFVFNLYKEKIRQLISCNSLSTTYPFPWFLFV